jgi:hypothetical protein
LSITLKHLRHYDDLKSHYGITLPITHEDFIGLSIPLNNTVSEKNRTIYQNQKDVKNTKDNEEHYSAKGKKGQNLKQ